MNPAVPIALVREVMIEAALADAFGDPVLCTGLLFNTAQCELLLLVAELDSPASGTTAERRLSALRIVAEMSRARQTHQEDRQL